MVLNDITSGKVEWTQQSYNEKLSWCWVFDPLIWNLLWTHHSSFILFIIFFTVRDDLCSSSLNFFEVCSSLCLWDCYLYFWFMDYVCLPLVPVCIFIRLCSLLLSSSFPFCLVSQSCLHVYLLPVTVSRSYVLVLVSVFVTSCFILIAPHLEWIAFSFGSPCLVNQIPFSYVPWCFPDVYILFVM